MASLDPAAKTRGSRTVVSVYVTDAEWLRAKQREISFRNGTYITMFDLMAEIVSRCRKAEEAEAGEA